MNWFENLIADLLNLLAQGIQGLSGLGLGDVIVQEIFPDASKVPNFGTAWFSDIMSNKALVALGPLASIFWTFGWVFFAVSIYFYATQVASAANSAIQRDRLKQGAVRFFLASILMWQGPRLALLISQMFFYSSEGVLSASGSLSTAMTTNGDGGQALLNSTVNLFSAVMSLIVWIIYEFRKIFLYAWMIFFPLAMAFYTNDKTRGIAKMWWWEWVYQMAVPLGQSLVYGIAVAIAKPDKGSTLTASDVFCALAGVIGLIASATYVRKIMDNIAQNFGASVMGFNGGEQLGHMAAMGAAFGLGDMAGKLGVKGAAKALGKPAKAGFKAFDNSKWVRNKTEKAINANPELHAQAIQAGAGIDDIMMHHQQSGFGDSIKAGGAGLEAAAVGGARGAAMGAVGSRAQPRHHTRHHGHRTVGALRDVGAGVKSTVAGSNVALIARSKLHGFKSAGGVTGKVGQAVASKIVSSPQLQNISPVANRAHNYLANRAMKQTRLDTMREHMRGVMETNASAQRLPHVSHLYDSSSNSFSGLSAAETAYSGARQQLVSAVQESMSISRGEASSIVTDWQNTWDAGKHVSMSSYAPQVQDAYRQAFSTYQPAVMDMNTKQTVLAGQLNVKNADPHQTMKHGTQALLNDARRGIAQGR